ncbi:VOC family protein [Brevibacillus massiliensis]|jgi:predicted 3-demethylubiquinone-9 3-methyltransferase (glyoxalase superfamily)|uniref:VOC family protein n=1 Tax=Brevibacillus massiliensis TaxID=1118054 RepID=UPI00031557EA|nr:VOC family protein [Brevibacillus massiliensis]
MGHSIPKVTTFLMFSGQAEEAMKFYTSLFDQSEIISIARYGPNEAGAEGTVMQAAFSLKGQVFMCIDSSVKHDFTFTPAMSLYVTCDTEEEIDRVFQRLAQDGSVLMPLAAYPFSEKFGWVADKYGVSWQLNLAKSSPA